MTAETRYQKARITSIAEAGPDAAKGRRLDLGDSGTREDLGLGPELFRALKQ
jgi:hypothetical protein